MNGSSANCQGHFFSLSQKRELTSDMDIFISDSEICDLKMDNNLTRDDEIVCSSKDSELDKLIAEYFELRIQENTSEEENKKLDELLDLAIVDEELEQKIQQIDILIYNLQKKDSWLFNLAQPFYGIDDFLDDVWKLKQSKKSKNQQIESEDFDQLARRLSFTPERVQRYVHFKEEGYERKVVFSSDDVCVYIISWLPGQKTNSHTHELSFCSTYIYQGTLTIEEFSSQEGTEQKEVKEYKQGDWALSPSNKKHRLSNNSCEQLVTIHYRYFRKSPKECEQLMPSCYRRDRNQESNSVFIA